MLMFKSSYFTPPPPRKKATKQDARLQNIFFYINRKKLTIFSIVKA